MYLLFEASVHYRSLERNENLELKTFLENFWCHENSPKGKFTERDFAER